MHHYRLYGLSICSSREIRLLDEIVAKDEPDLTVEWSVSDSETEDNRVEWTEVHSELLKLYTVITLWKNEAKTLTKITFEFESKAPLNFVVDSANKRLAIYHHMDELVSDLESYLVGPAMGITMRLRGFVCLHSSVVEVDGKAIALVGHSTAGKSTLAAGLAEAGARIMADDIAVLNAGTEGFVVQPGYSKVRLRPIAADFLTEDPDSLPIVYSNRDSRYVSIEPARNYNQGPVPLAAIYLLGSIGDEYFEPSIEAVESKDKLIGLLTNTYGSYVVMDNLRANEFTALSKIAQAAPMRRLLYAHDISTLPKQCEIILKDFRRIVGLSAED